MKGTNSHGCKEFWEEIWQPKNVISDSHQKHIAAFQSN